jgi:fatty acid-binding protein 3, muscle and heart
MAFIGTWTFESSHNFEEYLRALGLGMIQRKLASSLKPIYHISKDGNTWIIKMNLSIRTREIRFTEGVEFDEGTLRTQQLL